MPFIIGCDLQKYSESSQPMLSDSIQAYLDLNELIIVETLPPLPEKLEKQLRKRLQPFEKMSSNVEKT